MRSSFVFFLLSIFTFSSFTYGFATVNDFTTDKSSYSTGDSIKISGTVDYDPALFSVIVQIVTPSGNGLAHIDSAVPKSDGTFTKTIRAGGPTWDETGKYKIKISYGGNLEKLIDYQKISDYTPPQPTEPKNTPKNYLAETSSTDEIPLYNLDISFTENPKMRILGFPSFDKSPQYYIDRYNNEPEYQSWFDSQFPFYTIDEVVGYVPTSVENFPSFDKSPQYYIDRYNNEPEYQSWFDSQFPEQTIYSVLGFSTFIPDWIKAYAENWTARDISDDEFMTGLDFMLQNKIIWIPNFTHNDSSIDHIPA